MRRAFVAFPLLLILLTYAAGQTKGGEAKPTARAEDEVRIKEVLANFIEAWNKHDAKAFSMVFAEDTDFTNVRRVSAHGRADVEKFHAPLFATRFKDTNQKMTKTRIRFIKPDVAAVDAWWEMTGGTTWTCLKHSSEDVAEVKKGNNRIRASFVDNLRDCSSA